MESVDQRMTLKPGILETTISNLRLGVLDIGRNPNKQVQGAELQAARGPQEEPQLDIMELQLGKTS